MNTNPNGYDGGDLAGFQDPTPLQEGCNPWACTDRVGGEHAPSCDLRCWLCNRVLGANDADWRNISKADGFVERVCDTCWERGQEVEIPLDYTEDEVA